MNKLLIGSLLILLLAGVFLPFSGGCTTSSYTPGYEVRVLGNSEFLAGSRGAMRIITYNPANENPVSDVPVHVYLKKNEGDKNDKNEPDAKDDAVNKDNATAKEKVEDYGDEVFRGLTGKAGSIDAAFDIPGDMEGKAKLFILTGIKGKPQKTEADINVKKKFKIYLTTDKPMYQPGQVINIRALVLNVPSLKPVAENNLLFEIEDAKGNKVFKQKGATSAFGVASAKFQLADEVNMGEFHVRANLADESSEKSVTVKKYVLPKFKVEFKPDRKFYAPGDTIKGEIQADYFFGKPVAEGKVEVKLYTFDVEFRQAAEVKGKTDEKGHYSFELKIPDYLVGQPLEKGGAVSKVDVDITDTADHKEKTIKMIPISREALKVDMIPENKALKLNLDNTVYLMTGYPDGSPAEATVTVKFNENAQVIKTDKAGIGEFTLKPTQPGQVNVELSVATAKGDKIDTTKPLNVGGATDNVILRTDRAQYKVGDTMNLDILSTRDKGSVYVDIIKDNQTILTKAYDMDSTRFKAMLDLSPDMAGMLTLHAYYFTKENQIIRDTRNVFVRSADNLVIKTETDKPEFKPGEEGKISFNVTDKKGNPLAAALGVDIVDEAVFAMGEMLPGFEKVYFLLEKQLMEPKYEIHGFTVTDAVMPDEQIDQDQQMLRKVLFQEIPSEQKFTVNIDTYKTKLKECYEKMTKIQAGMVEFYRKYGKYPTMGDLDNLVKDKFIKEEEALDPWGHKFYLTAPVSGNQFPEIKSAGPDGQIDTTSDLAFSVLQRDYYKIMGMNEMQDIRRRGMMVDEMVMPAMAKGGMEKNDMAVEAEAPESGAAPGAAAGEAKKTVRIREFFPETLYTNPQVLTDDNGKAEIMVKMADSITTWRMSVFGNSVKGDMGNLQKGIRVFQDFFVDIDFPVALTEGDEVTVPVAIYNYLKEPQTVKISVEKADWFQMLDDKFEYDVQLKEGEVTAIHLKLKAVKLGKHKLTVNGTGSKMSDAIRREIDILPNGKMFEAGISDKLEEKVEKTINIPKHAIKGASKILVRIYPGVISQVVEGLDKIFQMPCGCFEQTSATTYPNVLVLDYLKRQKKVTPELQMKAEGYINTGYQRLVSFEVQGGGFSWFGTAPANQILTAFGILEFRDMAKVHSVDENLINRTQQWLARQQKPDGSWAPDANYLHAESWSKIQGGGAIPVTSYIVWALAESGYKGEDLKKGMDFLKKNAAKLEDPYTLALYCNALATLDPDNQFTLEMMNKLRKMAKITKDDAHWATGIQTGTYSHGGAADLETTAIATLACLKVKGFEDTASKAIAYIVKSKDPNGTWYSTQATILSMKALLLSQDKATQKVNAKVKITVNGQRSETFDVNSENFDVYRQADFGDITLNDKNKVEITLEGEGSCYYQIATRYYLPWGGITEGEKPLSINVKYDRTTLKENDMLTNNVKIRNNTKGTMKMVMVDLGVPPGFTVMTPDLQEYVGRKFMKYSMTSRQIIIYIETLKPGESIDFKYRLKAKFPLRAQTPESKVYQYYNPEVKDVSKPVKLEVKV